MNVVNQPIVKHKLGLLNLAEELGNVSQTCKIMDVSRDTFYRYQEAKASGGVEALPHNDRRRPNYKNRIDEVIEQADPRQSQPPLFACCSVVSAP